MAKVLTEAIQTQIDAQDISRRHTLRIDGVMRNANLISWVISNDKSFGSASASFILTNPEGVFSENGDTPILVGDVVEFIEKYGKDTTSQFKRFYGTVEQRSFSKSSGDRTITLNCLDYINVLQKTDIDLNVEATKIKVEEEILTPNYLPSPKDALSQVFNFANNSIAPLPPPILVVRPKDGIQLVQERPQFEGFDVKYAQGQVLLGTPLNARDNYDLVATSYFYYPQGIYIEDIIEDIIVAEDGYGNHIFNEASEQNVIDNHLTEDFLTVQGALGDTLTPNLTDVDVAIRTNLSQDFDPDASGAAGTTLYVDSTAGFPSSGTANINGDIFTWTSKTATTLLGVTGTTLKAHLDGSLVEFEVTCVAGRVWYMKYSNLIDDLDNNEFTGLPSAGVIQYVDKRFGRIILTSAISVLSSLTYDINYNFKTLQATGIEINSFKSNPREVENRFDALLKLREFLAPNYIVRTIGDNKIWASYLSQSVTPDYTLSLVQRMNFLEDEDLYTRVIFYGKNENPTNVLYRSGVQFVTTGQNYKALANQSQLQWEKEEDNFQVYKTVISDAGKIVIDPVKPLVYLNGVPVNDALQQLVAVPVVISVKQSTEQDINEHAKEEDVITQYQRFYYKIHLPSVSIEPTVPIVLYDSVGVEVFTIEAGDTAMNYGTGVYSVPEIIHISRSDGYTNQSGPNNETIESISTATYSVFYSTSLIQIDYDTVRFKVSKTLVPNKDLVTVYATFQYITAIQPISNIGAVIDGSFGTQVQTVFFAEPPSGLPYAILDLGQLTTIQALDITSGFFKPDDTRKYDAEFKITLKYSTDNVDYFNVSAETSNVDMGSGKSVRFEETELGVNFRPRYLMVVLEDASRIEYSTGVWVVAFTEISAYDDIILKGEATLISTTELNETIDLSLYGSSGLFPNTVNVVSTEGFSAPESAERLTAYIGEDSFTYNGLTATSFTGVQGLSEDHSIGERVSQELAGDSTVYDDEGLLNKLGDRLYKEIKISDEIVYSQSELDRLARAWLVEFIKNTSKLSVSVLYSPYLQVGQTVAVTDPYTQIVSVNYFIESITDNLGFFELVLARYPE